MIIFLKGLFYALNVGKHLKLQYSLAQADMERNIHIINIAVKSTRSVAHANLAKLSMKELLKN